MNRSWLYTFPSFLQAAATIWSLEQLRLKHLHAVFFCARTTPAWRVYTRVWDATSDDLVYITRILDAHGDRLHFRIEEFRRDSMQLMLAGTPAQIGEGLRLLAANGILGSAVGEVRQDLRPRQESNSPLCDSREIPS